MSVTGLHSPSPLQARTRVWRYSAIAIGAALLLSLGLWPEWGQLSGAGFMPHGYCLLWKPSLILLHSISDTLIGLSYIAISATLAYLVYRARRNIPFQWVFVAFGIFIVACGLTHLMGVVTLWRGLYWLSGDIKAITAAASLATAVTLPMAVPRMLALVERAKAAEQDKRHLDSVRSVLEEQLEASSKDVQQLAIDIAGKNEELERSNAALQESETRLSAIIGSAMDAIITVDEQQHIVVFNQAAEQIFGISAKEAMGQPLDRFIPPRYRAAHRVHVDNFGRTGTTSRSMYRPGTLFGLRASGAEFPIEATISQTETGGKKLYSVILRDISERKHAEELLRSTERLAAMGRLAGTIAHEINNPLEAINNLLYLLEHDQNVEEGPKQFVKLAREELQRITHITRQTLSFYREASEPVVVQISSVLDNVLELYHKPLQLKKIQVTRDYRVTGTIEGFPGQMRQVFSNLVVNAIEAMHEQGRLCIRVQQSRNWKRPELTGIRVLVADTGTGIPRENRRHIFEPFFTTKGEKGTGIGLWVSNGIVQKHGGFIRLRSSQLPGRSGTSFSVFLPAAAGAQGRRAA